MEQLFEIELIVSVLEWLSKSRQVNLVALTAVSTLMATSLYSTPASFISIRLDFTVTCSTQVHVPALQNAL